MKILILANNDVGLYQFRKELIQELLVDNEVYISVPSGDLVSPLVEMGCQFRDTFVDRRGMNPTRDLRLIVNYYRLLSTVQPDMVITYTIKPNIYGGFAAGLKKVPYAVNITGLGTAFQKKGILRSLVVTLYKIGVKKANTVFFENIENLRIFTEEGIVKPEKAVLLNGAGVNLDHFSPIEYPKQSIPTRFLFIGRVMREKGIDELLSAMKKLRANGCDCVLDVVGGYEEDYEEIIQSCSSKGWLNYHGYQKDVRPFIEQAHCFVLPSWHEGMANTNLECAASGRPVITSNIHGCLEAVMDGSSGFLCERKNSEDLFHKMKRFYELDYEKRKEMGVNARIHVEKNFDKKEVVKKTIDNLKAD